MQKTKNVKNGKILCGFWQKWQRRGFALRLGLSHNLAQTTPNNPKSKISAKNEK